VTVTTVLQHFCSSSGGAAQAWLVGAAGAGGADQVSGAGTTGAEVSTQKKDEHCPPKFPADPRELTRRWLNRDGHDGLATAIVQFWRRMGPLRMEFRVPGVESRGRGQKGARGESEKRSLHRGFEFAASSTCVGNGTDQRANSGLLNISART
jgi:hypothetical protein